MSEHFRCDTVNDVHATGFWIGRHEIGQNYVSNQFGRGTTLFC